MDHSYRVFDNIKKNNTIYICDKEQRKLNTYYTKTRPFVHFTLGN